MKLFILITITIGLFCFSSNGFCQKTFESFKQNADTITSSQDTIRESTTGTQSNLAVSDHGTPADKSKKNSFKITEPIDKLKKKITSQAVNNNNGTVDTSNLAVSDPGSPADKSGKNKRETTYGNENPSKKTSDAPETISPR